MSEQRYHSILETDVCVIGGSSSGMPAAITAADRGAKVIILEKTKRLGGTLGVCCGFFGVESPAQKRLGIHDTAEDCFRELIPLLYWNCDARLVHFWLNDSGESVRWLESLGMEFATAAFHNSYYFHKDDNVITNKDEVCRNFEQLIAWQLQENHPKSWFRAWFNMGLINYIEGGRRMLPCEAGSANFFIDPFGDVYPCNGLEEKYWQKSMGNIHQTPDFMEIWQSARAEEVRAMVRKCPKNCWMVGTASPVMHKYVKYPLKWALRNKLRSMRGKPACLDKKWCDVGQDPAQGDLKQRM